MTVLQESARVLDVDERLEAQIFIRAVLDRTSLIDAVDVARGCRGILVRRCEHLVLDHDPR
jgi:hypothetical protein